MKVVLFCGGRGLRIREHSGSIPKPMVMVGGRPILWHIMAYYAYFGHRDFVLCVGYGADVIRSYFAERRLEATRRGETWDWSITFVDTGLDTPVGQRLRAARPHSGVDDVFLANYGDVLTDAPLPELLACFRSSGKLAALSPCGHLPTPFTSSSLLTETAWTASMR